MYKWFSVQKREIVSGIPNRGSDFITKVILKLKMGLPASGHEWLGRGGPWVPAWVQGHIFSAFLPSTKPFRQQLSRGQEKDGTLTIIICWGKSLYPARNDGRKTCVMCIHYSSELFRKNDPKIFFFFFVMMIHCPSGGKLQ